VSAVRGVGMSALLAPGGTDSIGPRKEPDQPVG
jgi:hypothetical protein